MPWNYVTVLADMIDEMEQLVGKCQDDGEPDSAREFAIARTSLEDAQMRINRGYAHLADRVKVSDMQTEYEQGQ